MKCDKGHSFDDSGTNCPDCADEAGYERGVAEERERCAKIADQFKPWALRECNVPWEVSTAIREGK